MEPIAQRHEIRGVRPEAQESSSFAGCAAGDFGGFEEGNGMFLGVEGGVAGEEVGGCAADYAAACVGG